MPPVNTPAQRSPPSPRTPTHPPGWPLTPLSYLSSPAPDLASTLHTSAAADQADESNVTFLRDSLDSLDQPSERARGSHIDAQRDPRQREQTAETEPAPSAPRSRHDTPEDLSRRERLQRVLARLNRLHEPSSASSTSAYSNRTPSPNRQSLYDWAPAYGENQQEDGELEAILSELRRQQPDTHPEILRVLSQSQLEGSRQQRDRSLGTEDISLAESNEQIALEASNALDRLDRFERRTRERRERERRARETEWSSLRSRAMLQRARQDGGGSPSSTERMLRYVMDRERSGMSEEEERARGSGWFRPSPTRGGNEGQENGSANAARGHSFLQPPSSELRDRDRQERVDAFRRGYLADNAAPRSARISTSPAPAIPATPAESPGSLLESALKYLSELRECSRYEDALSTAIDHGLATKEFFAVKHDDFVMDLHELAPLPYSSWLQPGTVFEGHQHASANIIHHAPPPATSSLVEQINPNYHASNAATTTGFDHPPGSTRVTPFDASRSSWQFTQPTMSVTAPSKDSHDHWPVRVIIHSIDAETMTLQGTMEAYDVPQHHSGLSGISSNGFSSGGARPRAGKKSAPITTYLEGHIIDLRTHSFLTPGAQDGKRATSNRANSLSANETNTNNTSSSSSSSTIETIHFPSANAHTDAQNWLKLPPFSHLTTSLISGKLTPIAAAAELSRILLSKSRLQTLHEDYIFMRWKEKCFVHAARNDPCTAPAGERSGDQDRGHGLTISGFYYVSLRRCDGVVEGLYFDPSSTPFQHLRLKGYAGGWGAWGFR